VQAEYGDCFILESSHGNKKATVLIDGGPDRTFEKHLKPTLQKLPFSGKLDLMVSSHIDNDHIIRLLDLLNEIKTHREDGMKGLIKITKIWHNSYKELLKLRVEPNKLLRNIFPIQGLKNGKSIVELIVMKGFQLRGLYPTGKNF
jgi:beta-lactamase superfamily II metal-dependent hydrolase